MTAKIIGKGKDWVQISWEDDKNSGYLGIRTMGKELEIDEVIKILNKAIENDRPKLQHREPGDGC